MPAVIMKRKGGVVQAAVKDEEQVRRKIARKEYEVNYRRSQRQAARTMDRCLGVTRVGLKAADLAGSEPGMYEVQNERECYKKDEVAYMDEHGIFDPISENLKQSVYQECSKRFRLPACDALLPPKSIRKCEVLGNSAKKWVNRLLGLDDVPTAYRREYDVSSWLPQMRGALLSPCGLVRNSDNKLCGLLQVCSSCYNSLKSNSKLPPKFAVANGFDIGILPKNLLDASWIERATSSVTSVAASITVLRGGRHQSLRGHVTVVTLDPGSISRRLPVLLRGRENFFVVMASRLTPHQRLLAMRKYRVRRTVVSRLLEFYVNNNVLYRDSGVEIDREALDSLETKRSRSEDPLFCQELESEYYRDLPEQSFSLKSVEHRGPEIETAYSEESFAAVQSDENTTVEILDAAKEVLVVKNYGKLVFTFDSDLLDLSFPDLFPRGRGHPGMKRQIRVSFEVCIRYYLRISSHQFSQHPSFVFVVFDVCGKRRVVSSTTVRSLYRPEEFEKIGNLSREQVVTAIEVKKEERKRMINGLYQRHHDSKLPGDKLLRHVFASQSSMWGSSAERLTYRRKGFCMDAYFKSGAVFVTITPDEAGTMIISVLAGKVSFSEVEAMVSGDIPKRASRIEVASSDPVACAEYFYVICEDFFEVIVGFDLKRKLPYRGGGLFGVVKAFFGTVETQSSVTLHMHCILYIAWLPRTSADFAKRCEDLTLGTAFKERFKALVDSVVSTSVPAYDFNEDVSCPRCNRVGGIEVLKKLPRAAYRMPLPSQKLVSTTKCRFCQASFGSTQILRHQVKVLHDLATEQGCKDLIPLGNGERDSDRIVETFLSVPKFLKRPLQQERRSKEELPYLLLLSQTVLLTQQHNARHVRSCFKKKAWHPLESVDICFRDQEEQTLGLD